MISNYVRNSTQAGISDSDVLDIRDLAFRGGLTATQIAAQYGIDRTTAARIINNRTWAHVPSPRLINGYEVYPDGRVYSSASGRFLTISTNKQGQRSVTITKKGIRSQVPVANLVAKAFINERLTVTKRIDFVDGNPANIHFTNLVVKQ